MTNQPSKLYVETTTRCNLRCAMCVKQAKGANIPETDMPMEVFSSLAPAFPHLENLILNGIGEPLLSPRLAEMIAMARSAMPEDANISFQTNGMLLTQERAEELVDAGLSTICLSVDAVHDDSLFHGGENINSTAKAFDRLRRATETTGRSLRIGVEFVLMRDTAETLPRTLEWAAAQGAEFALVTHMLPYCETVAHQELFNPNTDKSMAEFAKWKRDADKLGFDLSRYFGLPWKFIKTPQEKALVDFVDSRRKDAIGRGIPMHVTRLVDWTTPERLGEQKRLKEILQKAQTVADENNIEVTLPPVTAKHDRYCEFVEQEVAHITPEGDVRPCYFLWHEYSCFTDNFSKKVDPVTFGNVLEKSILDIWNSDQYRHFRSEVLSYDYPYCSNCTVIPCSDVTGHGRAFEHDCVGVDVPCGHCIWCMGGVRCLL